MKMANIQGIVCLVVSILFTTPAFSENILNSDLDYSIPIAVTINKDDHMMGKLEYSNRAPQYPLQLVAFNPIGGVIFSEPYLFEILDREIISKNVHRIRCRSINDRYGSSEITGVIDFSNEMKPKIHLVNEFGHTYISNISQKGRKVQKQYLPKVFLGR